MKNNRTLLLKGFTWIMLLLFVAASLLGVAGSLIPMAAAESDDAENDQPILYYPGATDDVRSTDTETFTYARYDVQEGDANPYCPQYYNTNSSLSSACAPIGGAIVMGFYDRYYTNLIPNFTPGFTLNGYYRYYAMAYDPTTIQGVIDTLYTDMGTNQQQQGTSRAQYQAGLGTYATAQGYSVGFSTVMSGGALNSYSVVSQLLNGTIITLYISNHNLCNISLGSDSATYNIVTYTGNHIFIAYKYKIIRYYSANNINFRTDLFLGVSTGLSISTSGWYYVGYSGSTLNDADATYVY